MLNVLPLSNVKQEVDAAIIEFRLPPDAADEEAGEDDAGEFPTAMGES